MIVEYTFKLYGKYPGIATRKTVAETKDEIVAEIHSADSRLKDVDILSIREGKK